MTLRSLTRFFKAKKNTGALLTTLLLVLGMVLAACGGSTGSGSGQNAHNNYLTISTGPTGDFTKNFGPYTPNANPGTVGMVYETLLYVNGFSGKVTPWLATDYKFSSDNKTLTFTTRQNVKWSDGQPFSADDVAFTLNLFKQYPATDTNGLWNYFDSVTASDDHTVVITMKKVYTPILYSVGGTTWIVPKHLWANVGDPSKYTNPTPVGTGPFTLKSFSPQLLDYTKNPSYWQADQLKVNELRYPSYNSNQSLELDMDKGNLDWVSLFTPNLQKGYIDRDPQHNKYWFPSGNNVSLFMNLTKAPFNNVNVRKAISMALDRDKMFHVAESNFEPVANPTGLILPAQKDYLNPEYQNLTYQAPNVSQATQLLESAGLKKGSDGIYVDKDGKKLSFNLNVVTGWSDWVTMCQMVNSDLKAIGIQTNVNAIAYNSYVNALNTGSFDMSIGSVGSGPSPFYTYNNVLSKAKSAPIGGTAVSNYERWEDPTTDSLLTQYSTTTDPNVQKQAIQGLEKIMVEQVPIITLVYGADWNEYSTKNFTGWPTADNPYAVPPPWQYPDAAVVILHLSPAQ
ncbi:ABC transporter substrate-binding protein [Ktedonobacter robiniae]|uniref:Peptide ABC transporter substrate-binding protein n=1 Tax=Ktedonobacter robiniae TaxID=2778365 RepID=A0ABQ3V4C9_9CHLR|nr:ABC transporter substrate-binding protein [Ktedonobacter robiniae]GHO59778.1 peptide ABC transporter substrate-binding protein [Ktedonobacter robiniae]